MAAVMCMGDTKHSPSTTPLRSTMASTCGVRCTISYRFLVVRVRYSVWAFIPAIASPFRLRFPKGICTHPHSILTVCCRCAHLRECCGGVGVAESEFPDWKLPKGTNAAQVDRSACNDRHHGMGNPLGAVPRVSAVVGGGGRGLQGADEPLAARLVREDDSEGLGAGRCLFLVLVRRHRPGPDAVSQGRGLYRRHGLPVCIDESGGRTERVAGGGAGLAVQ